MKKLIIALVSFLAIAALGLLCFMAVAIHNGGFIMTHTTYSDSLKLVNTQTVSLSDITNISIKYYAEDVVIYSSDTDKLVLMEYRNGKPKNDDSSQIKTSGSHLFLQANRSHYLHQLLNLNRSCRIEIYLPTGYSKDISIQTASGDITSDPEFNFDHFTAASTSGDIMIDNSDGDLIITSTSGNITVKKAVGKLNATSTSGDILLNSSSGDKNIETTSGQITITDSDGYTETTSTSGDIRITELAGTGKFHTVTGEIQAEFSKDTATLQNDIYASTTSGNISLALPKSLSFEFSADVSSGSIHTFFDDQLTFHKDKRSAGGSIGIDPVLKLDLSSTSGDINITER